MLVEGRIETTRFQEIFDLPVIYWSPWPVRAGRAICPANTVRGYSTNGIPTAQLPISTRHCDRPLSDSNLRTAFLKGRTNSRLFEHNWSNHSLRTGVEFDSCWRLGL